MQKYFIGPLSNIKFTKQQTSRLQDRTDDLRT
jgi:hypothetical protein